MGAAAAYLRLSQEDRKAVSDSESNSISNQRILIQSYIKQDEELRKLQILEFCDDGYSGTSMSRPGMTALLNEVRKGRVECIIVKDLSRFSRDYIELGTYLNQILPFMGVRFIAVADRYDSRSHRGTTIELDTAFKTLLNDLYSRDISVKVKASLKNKYADGEYAFGQVPFGYKKGGLKKNDVSVNEEEAAVVRRIFALACQGRGCAEIARLLHEEKVPTASQFRGIKTPEGKGRRTWSCVMVRNVLKNRFYLGEMSYGKSIQPQEGNSRRKAVPREDWQVIRGHHEALVTEEEFERAARDSRTSAAKRKLKKHPLVGKLSCAGCGYAMLYKPHKYRRFECSRHSILKNPDCCTYFRADVLEELVLSMLNQELMLKGEAARQQESLAVFYRSGLTDMEKRKETLRRRQEETDASYEKLYERYAAGEMTAEEYRKAADAAEKEKASLSEQMCGLQAEIEQAGSELERLEADMKQVIRYSHIEELSEEIAGTFIKRIYLHRDKQVEIEWTFEDRLPEKYV